MRCPNCGGTDWDDSHVRAGAALHYKSDRASWFAQQFRQGTKVAARACLACGHLDLRIPID